MKEKVIAGMTYGTGRLWKAAAALLLALVVSLGTLRVAQATHQVSDPKPGWYEVGGSAADRNLSKSSNGAVVATWTHVEINQDYSLRAYWAVENTSSSPQTVGCQGYDNYGLEGFKAKTFYHTTFNWEVVAKDALCAHLGRGWQKTLPPGQTMTSWADFPYGGKKGTCTALTLPTGPNVPDHVGYTKCVNPYERYLGNPSTEPNKPPSAPPTPPGSPQTGQQFEFPWDDTKTLAYTGGPHRWNGPKMSGLDFSDKSESTPILAMADGTVTFVGLERCKLGDCKVVKVSHDNGWEVWYVHLSRFAPAIEELCKPKPSYCSAPVPVKQGQWLGNEGATGAGGAIHIHIELRKGPNSEPHEWSEVSGGIQGWKFHTDCNGYDKSKVAYDEKRKMSQKNQECIPYKTNGIDDGYNYDGYMSKGDIHAIPWFGPLVGSTEPGAQYWVHSNNSMLGVG